MIANTESFVSHVAAHAGVPLDRAERAARAVLSRLGAYPSEAHRLFVAEELPAALGAALLAGGELALPIEEYVRARGMTVAQAHELTASVCHVLTEVLSTEALGALRASVPIDLATMLAPPSPDAAIAPPTHRDTLATGIPGSHRGLSDARPEPRQTGSIADDNPHEASKLSSAPGSTQERRRATLAEGQPDSSRSLAGSRR